MNLFLPDEHVIIKLRSHPIVLFGQIFVYLVLIIIPLIVKVFLDLTDYPLHVEEPFPTILLFGGALYYLYLLLFIFYTFFNYYLDIWIVTDKHIIDIEQRSLFNRSIAKQELFRIQDIKSEIKGVIPTLLNYGNVHIQTAGEVPYFIFNKIPDPNRIVNTILKLVEEAIRDQPQRKDPLP